MSIKQNFPTIKPTLNLDFANSKAVDSRITFIRASAATVTNAQGILQTIRDNKPRIDFDPTTGECKGLLIEEQRTNTASPSSYLSQWQFINGGYIIEKAGLSPDGSMNAAIHGSTTTISYLRLYPTLLSGTTYTFSVWVKKSPNTSKAAPKWFFGLFNLTTGDSAYQTITPTDSWQRVSVTLTMTGNGGTEVQLGTMKDNAGNNLSGAEVMLWGPQVETGTFPTSYIPSTTTFTSRASSATYFDSTGVMRTAPANGARYGYGYDSASGKWVSQGLLLESAATNYLSYSDIANSRTANFYVGSNAVDLGVVAGPDGTMSARRLKFNAASNSYFNTVIPSLPAGTYTFSVWVRLNAGTPTNSIAYSSAYGNGWAMNAAPTSTWQRVYGTYTTGSNQTNVNLTLPYYDSQANCEIDYAWLQMETGSVPTSYIPTYGSTATRSADVSSSAATTRAKDSAQLTGTNFSSWYNQSESTIYTEADILGVSTSGAWAGDIYCFGSNGTEAISAGINNTTPSIYAGRSAVGGATLFTATYNTPFKIAQSFNKSTTYHYASGNGGATQGPLGYGVPYQDSLTIGDSPNVSLRTMSGHIKKLTYYPKAVTAAQLQALTV